MPASRIAEGRAVVRGRFLHLGDEKLLLKGVTYGPFADGPDGTPYDPDAAERDFAAMRGQGFTVLRTYTAPPRWLLDAALRHGLRVLAGVAWEQHVAFLDDRGRVDDVVARVAGEVRKVAGHPALLGWAVGNEIPAPVVRWHGRRRTEAFLRRLYDVVRQHDPGALVTYVNYPTTEYLDLGFLDFVCFNVFLERREEFVAYLHRLQNLVGERPLVLTEIGLDSRRNGLEGQADSLAWQVREAMAAGCAGAFVFAWSDEWHRGGQAITDWDFGLTGRAREPKPALAAVREAWRDAPVPLPPDPPLVSVVICTYNGAKTLDATCAAVRRLEYPAFEVIVIDDGSTDASVAICAAHGLRVVSTENRGLSSARNTGAELAAGEIVAYLDDDAMPDPHWLHFLVDTYAREDVVAVGGPNLAVPGDGLVADAVAISPGNPSHVLLSDREAEHIPGCNSSFRRDALQAIGGFDPRFHVAGDDVDVCWRLQDAGGRIGFSAAAVVFHHRRGTVGGYLRQQRGYGHAEAMLERKWPERYSAGGHVTWAGRIYGDGTPRAPAGRHRWRVYHGTWNSAPFQRLYEPGIRGLDAVLLMPEAYLGIGGLILLAVLGAAWSPLLLALPVLAVIAGLLSVRAVTIVAQARLPTGDLPVTARASRRGLAALLHLLQPLLRLDGRLRHGLTPWRRRGRPGRARPSRRTLETWHEEWRDPFEELGRLQERLVALGAIVRHGQDFDTWDLEVRGGTLAGVRITTLVEEHGQGRQLVRSLCRPTYSRPALLMNALAATLALAAAADGAPVAAAVLGLLAVMFALRIVTEAASAVATAVMAIQTPHAPAPPLAPVA
ncbi:glycosyltransferase [Paraconexibacter antarcticus]|nr:glycosyltransferase [Paraconexibacter antarcticus]